MAQAHAMDTIKKTSANLRYLESLLLRNASGHFVRVMTGEIFKTDWAWRGAAFGDIDNDGDIDRVVSASGLTQYFTISTAVGCLSARDKHLIAGLGEDSTAKLIEIRWPSGVVQKFENVKAGQMLRASEPIQ